MRYLLALGAVAAALSVAAPAHADYCIWGPSVAGETAGICSWRPITEDPQYANYICVVTTSSRSRICVPV